MHPDRRQHIRANTQSGTQSSRCSRDATHAAARARKSKLAQAPAGGLWVASAISPDGATILTESVGTLMLVPAAGAKPSQITIHMTPPAVPDNASRPGLSPDGSHIVFPLQVFDSHATDIYTMRRDGTNIVRITNSPQDEEFKDWVANTLRQASI